MDGQCMYVRGVRCVCLSELLHLLVTLLSHENDRTANLLERLRQTRKGQPLPPQVDVKIS
jgi:hypothetical protein